MFFFRLEINFSGAPIRPRGGAYTAHPHFLYERLSFKLITYHIVWRLGEDGSTDGPDGRSRRLEGFSSGGGSGWMKNYLKKSLFPKKGVSSYLNSPL